VVTRIFLERLDMGDELHGLFDLDQTEGETAGECAPPFDVVETEGRIEVTMDLPGVPIASVRVLFARNTLIVAGRKLPAACEHREAAFHLAERTFGRFARAVRLTGAFDAGRAEATLVAGELRVTLPRSPERRGGEIRIPIRS
jgi:HSP20 family protein